MLVTQIVVYVSLGLAVLAVAAKVHLADQAGFVAVVRQCLRDGFEPRTKNTFV